MALEQMVYGESSIGNTNTNMNASGEQHTTMTMTIHWLV